MKETRLSQKQAGSAAAIPETTPFASVKRLLAPRQTHDHTRHHPQDSVVFIRVVLSGGRSCAEVSAPDIAEGSGNLYFSFG